MAGGADAGVDRGAALLGELPSGTQGRSQGRLLSGDRRAEDGGGERCKSKLQQDRAARPRRRRLPSPALLGKVARSAGWGMARRLNRESDCTSVTLRLHRRISAFHTPSGALAPHLAANNLVACGPPTVATHHYAAIANPPCMACCQTWPKTPAARE